ncbi:hypothetical protein WJX73_002695 [Symbiochloris irregularis]|uniref:Uncharacterized protein n=1 Tax=Symbiochloris irregularis TaxID=706552 RepID=A0AAW1NKD5_9CHLO
MALLIDATHFGAAFPAPPAAQCRPTASCAVTGQAPGSSPPTQAWSGIHRASGKRRSSHVCRATTRLRRASSEGPDDGPANTAARAAVDIQAEDRRRFLLKYVQEVEPELMEQFGEVAPFQVVDAMRETLARMLGTLPPQFFQVTVSTRNSEDLAQLFYSVMMTGYMFRNAQYRLELRRKLAYASVDGVASGEEGRHLPAAAVANKAMTEEQNYAAGSQKHRVVGDVVRWRHDTGAETMSAAQYIESLESEVQVLRQQVAADLYLRAGGNELLNYLKVQEPACLAELTACARDDTYEAMNSFIHRLLGTADAEELQQLSSINHAPDLSRLLYWLMVVGYNMRTLEVRWDVEQSMML